MSTFNELMNTKEEHNVDIKELCVDPKMQMRVEMCQSTIEQYAENISVILEENPIEIVIVEHATGDSFYVVDGFHRYFASLAEGLEVIPVYAYRGTYEQALQYAMSANFKNGLRPNSNDQKKAIARLLDTAPDFGYDSKQVNVWLANFVPKSTARNHSAPYIESIKAKRDAKILELHEEGKSQNHIKDFIGCAKSVVNDVVNGRKSPVDKNDHQEPDPELLDEDEETCSSTNPADILATQRAEREQKALDKATAMNKELAAQDECALSPPNVHSNVNENEDGDEYVSPLEKALRTLEAHASFLTDEHKARIATLLDHA